MSITIVKTKLFSREFRQKLVPNGGKRSLDLKHPIIRTDEKNVIDRIGDFFNNSGLTGFLSGTLNFLGWAGGGLATSIFGWLQGAVIQLWNFDWNASDKKLEALMESQNIRIASAWGSALGGAFGWLVGIGIGYGVSFLCPVIGGAALAKAVSVNVGKEAIGEVTRGIGAALSQTVGALGNNALISSYINIRKLIKSAPESFLNNVFGKKSATSIKKQWGDDAGPTVTLSKGFESFVDWVTGKDKAAKAFADSFFDEAYESFSEAGYIVAYEIDAAYAQAKRANENTQGKRRTVRLTPDKRRKEELILSASTVDVESSTLETLNTYRLVANRDMGQIIGMPAEDYLTAKPLRRQLTLVYKGKAEPPWKMANGKPAKQVEITIPDAIVGLTWQKIKLAAKNYTWGKFRATAHLDNGRQMAIYGASKGEAERTLKRFATLSTAKILTLNVTEEVEKKNINLRKNPTPIYPAYATLVVRRPTNEEGKNFIDGTKLVEDLVRIDLWTKTEPKGIPPLK